MTTNNAPQTRHQQTSYPSPHSYPSPSMQPTYTYPPPSGQAQPEPYRASPTASNVSLPSLNLPPIRAIDAQSQPPPQQQHHPPQQSAPPAHTQSGSPLPPPPATMSGYYPQQAHGMQNLVQPMGITSSPQPLGMRYPLPAQGQDQRIMSGGRHKKEIKRRTKTGCLTCRKRRIKCDEAHPTCRNCQKSKRECLGYDPIFKPQASPANLQPAPSASPTGTPSSNIPLPSAPAYPNVPQGYNPPTAPGYAQAPAQQQPGAASSSYDFGPAIDPALAAAEMQHAQSHLELASSHRAPPQTTRSQPGTDGRPRVRLDDLHTISGVAPPSPVPRTAPPSEAAIEEVKLLYHRDYAPGLDKFLETTWYSQRSWPKLIHDGPLFDLFIQMLDRFRAVKSDDYRGAQLIRSLETKVVWRLLCMPRSPHAAANGVTGAPSPEEALQLLEAQKRLDAFEALLTHTTLDRNPLLDVHYQESLQTLKYWEVEFWRLLGQIVSRMPTPASNSEAPVPQLSLDDMMQACRNILSMLENRDVLYSMLVCRVFGSRLPGWPDIKEVFNTDQEDPRLKVFIGKKFLEEEAGGKGTNQVVQRMCDMAVRSWTLGR
ncbi:hypothetical protein NA57DRAFT_79836 [Rhizodiscina lignyota]|uniref:Zn(2)-C6 fungal-type domain-containing protein n=1 Tax=Rhizodiscina lignyota TaxID=1504668 RepID=A0A9P4I867_9PEZI|nr:hypothetical protein NA57DRAFT_79836 [Rhizodiscina lignyota]